MTDNNPPEERSTGKAIAIQDRRRLFREGLALVLGNEPDLRVVAAASTAQELVEATAGSDLDVVLLELDCEAWNPYRLAFALQKRHPGLAVVGTVASADPGPSVMAYRAGVRSVFARDAGMRTLLQTIRSLPGQGRSPLARLTVGLPEAGRTLSPRELEVLAGISSGRTTQAVASALGISPKTVENHKQRIFAKLGVQNQAHAVAVACRQGLLPPGASRNPATFPPLSA